MARKPHESRAEEARAGRKGAKAEPRAAKAKGGRDARGGHTEEHKMAEVHVHHHHHHHTGAAGGKK